MVFQENGLNVYCILYTIYEKHITNIQKNQSLISRKLNFFFLRLWIRIDLSKMKGEIL